MTTTKDVPFDKLVNVYTKIRSRMQEVERAKDAEIEDLKSQLDIIAAQMREHMKATGSTSVRTQFGLAVMSTRTRYWASDWDHFKTFVIQHNAIDLLERRIAQTNMKKFLEDNPGTTPPGLNADSELVISVRKPT